MSDKMHRELAATALIPFRPMAVDREALRHVADAAADILSRTPARLAAYVEEDPERTLTLLDEIAQARTALDRAEARLFVAGARCAVGAGK